MWHHIMGKHILQNWGNLNALREGCKSMLKLPHLKYTEQHSVLFMRPLPLYAPKNAAFFAFIFL